MGRRKDNSSDQEPTPSDGESGPLWPGSEFGYLRAHDEQLVRLGRLADRYLAEHPGLALTTLTQFAELLARLMAAKVGMLTSQEEAVPDLLRRLQDHGILPPEVARLFYAVRRASHDAADAKMSDPSAAIVAMRLTQQLGLWFHRTFADPAFVPTPDAVATGAVPTTDSLESLAADIERGQPAVNARLAAQQARGLATPKADLAALLSAASTSAAHVDLDEFDTRKLIDQQLRLAGWTVDTATLTYSRGARPKKGRNLAIAEWPTENGPADYILFVGLTPVATVEAKRKNKDVSGCIQQAKRYSRGFVIDGTLTSPGGPWLQHKLPFVFSTNGRPYLRQLETRSGIWFCDVRLPDRLGHALDGWYTPEGLTALLKRDEVRAHQQLSQEPFAYGFTLRPYQQTAIQAVESAIAKGQRAILLAMATGTGKTKTCIALIYRLLKVQRFRRILFLVDRAALGEQAANAFKDTRMEGLQTFAETFGIKEFDEAEPESATVVHVATVQGMVKRILYCRDSDIPPAVDQYDCIIVDECHRGYLLDRELSDAEMVFRSHEDYISKYRRVLDYFDAVKVGLTATPALHTSEIFGAPVFHYTYREAVIDGFLVDHEPPVQIHTDLSQNGIVWAAGERVAVYHTRRNEVSLYTTPDEIKLEVEDFNRKVITEPWNRVVCEFLAREIDPSSRQKTLIFCANDAHADLVVKRLKLAFEARYGAVEDDAVIKITGAADKTLQLIRRYKNERQPSVAVTVDLLTTGVDVPEICNLVFLRRVNSRILFDQMLGRATRLCDKIGKATFRIFDAVRIYEALQPVTAMQPVVVDPTTRFVDLAQELTAVPSEESRALIRDEFIAKLQRRKRSLTERAARDFETCTGLPPDDFIRKLRSMTLQAVVDWFAQHPELAEILERKGEGPGPMVFIHEGDDRLSHIERGYGKATKPEDYLKEFSDFIRSRSNSIPALITVLTRPRELTRKQLRELLLELDKAGYSEAALSTAWREMTNQDIAARIVGFIRKAAIGDALVPYEQRVDRALSTLLASKNFTTPQRQWLQKIAAQTKANLVVDREALDDPDLVFKREGGGFNRLDRLFGGELLSLLNSFNEALWQATA